MKYAIHVELEYVTDGDPTERIHEILQATLSYGFAPQAEHYHLLGAPRELGEVDEELATAKKALARAVADPEVLDSVRALTNEELKQQFVEATIGVVALKDEVNRRSGDEEARRTEEDAQPYWNNE